MSDNAGNFLTSNAADLNIHKKKAYELVFEKLEDSIISGDIKPGEKVPTERDLAKIFNVSRNTVRTALKLLEFTELIEIKHGVGIIVSEEINKDEELIEEKELLKNSDQDPFELLLEVREILSPGVAALAAKKADAEDIENMRNALAKMEDSIKNNKYMKTDAFYFYNSLYLATKNIFLYKPGKYFEKLLRDTKAMSNKVEERAPEVLEYLRAVFAAIEKHDEVAARNRMTEYLENLKRIHFG